MGLRRYVRTHRGISAFAAGVLLTLAALAAFGYYVLSDQRRTARILAAALSQALAREVRIERVTDVGTERVVMRGVRLPSDGGWPADLVAERVEATGPLLAAARGDAAPVRLVVTRPTVDVPAGGGVGIQATLENLRQGLASFLAGAVQVDATLTAGVARYAGGTTEFDLALRKAGGGATGELTLREAGQAPLVVSLNARTEGDLVRLALSGRGALAPVAAWIEDGGPSVLRGQSVEVSMAADLGPAPALNARGTVSVGDVMAGGGTAVFKDGVLQLSLPHATADLAFAAWVARLGWQPTGRAELADLTATWRPNAGSWPVLQAVLRLPSIALPAAAVGTDVRAEGVEGRLALEPVPSGHAVSGEARAERVRAAGLEIAPADTRYRLTLDAGGAIARAELAGLTARLEGAVLKGSLGYDGATRRLDTRLGGEEVDVGGLVRRLAPGWLAPADRLRLAGLSITGTGVDARELGAGTVRLEARSARLSRANGELGGGRTTVRAELGRTGVTLALETASVSATLPALNGKLPLLAGSAELHRTATGLEPERGRLTARDGQGRELLVASLARGATPGRLRLSVQAPALERLDGLWPQVARRVNGSARLDVELSGPGYGAADGRLALSVPEGEVWGGKVFVRSLEADVPIRRGVEMPGEPPWGKIEVGELIGYGVVARDVVSPARVFRDRLSLNDLTYALYSGEGKGWSEIELDAAGPMVRGKLNGERVRVEEFMSAYGIRGGTMTGLLQYDLGYEYRAGRLQVNGRFEVPKGGTVNIELLNRLLAYAQTDPSGVLRGALENLRAFEYKHAEADVHSAGDDVRVNLALQGRERFLIFPPKVREINIRNMPLSFLARQFPGAFAN